MRLIRFWELRGKRHAASLPVLSRHVEETPSSLLVSRSQSRPALQVMIILQIVLASLAGRDRGRQVCHLVLLAPFEPSLPVNLPCSYITFSTRIKSIFCPFAVLRSWSDTDSLDHAADSIQEKNTRKSSDVAKSVKTGSMIIKRHSEAGSSRLQDPVWIVPDRAREDQSKKDPSFEISHIYTRASHHASHTTHARASPHNTWT